MIFGIAHKVWFKRTLLLGGALILGVSASGCAGSPDLERVRGNTQPEAVLYKWFINQTGQVLLGHLQDWPLLEPCWLTIDSFDFDLKNDDGEEALRAACARLEDINRKYEDIRRFREWSLENPFLRPPWREIAGELRTRESSNCCDHLVHLLMWEDFSNEIRETRDRLYSDLVCGFEKDYFYDSEHRCRERDSLPVLTPTFPQAVSAVEAYLQDSAKYHATRCESEACREKYGAEDKRRENLINHTLSIGRFEPFQSRYTPVGGWRVLLVASWPESGRELIECFKVLNKPGKYTESRNPKKVVDADYPWVIHCGGINRLGEGYFQHNGSLETWRMSD